MTAPTCLLIEDDDVIRDLLRKAIERIGYQVTCAKTYVEAEACWETRESIEGGFLAVVTDDEIPPEAGRLPRSHAREIVRMCHEHAQVVIHSGHGRYRFAQACDDYGVDAIPKGQTQELLGWLERVKATDMGAS